ncbi:GNAT family N-acetyltransferase [Novispirillum itersonii]|uniref:GNAT family N-acetyltransferase n=1 Tax=Novispirillum itersonii TaxID=189 RepID=UPI0003A1E853|nr:GNAT family N-acetyltransferase [Novispirillum itersonii]
MYSIIHYTPERRDEWNAFVASSKNGTFLFDRNYMDYHADRFADGSLMIYENAGSKLVSVLPANIKGKEMVSHGGLTYGGLVVGPAMTTPMFLQMFEALCDHLRQLGLDSFVYKTVPTIYHRLPAEEDRYALFLSKAVLFRRDTLSVRRIGSGVKIQERRRRGMKKATNAGLTVRLSHDYAAFWEILEANLKEQHGTRPVHSLAEITLLSERFPNNIQLAACYDGDRMLAGTVLYRTPTVLHAQYIGSSKDGRDAGALDLLFGSIETFAQDEIWFDFGISNEAGSVLNSGLIEFKEGFAARTVVHDYYRVDLNACRPERPRFALGDAIEIGNIPNDQPIRLTVNIITYNQKDMIGPFLDDVMAEVGTMDGVEVLVGDDGSQDGTQDVLRDYVERWPGRLRAILGNRNVGPCANGNRNMAASRGQYVALLAGDDKVLPGKFHRQMEFLDRHPDVGLCYHDILVVSSTGEFAPWRFSDRHPMYRGNAATVIRHGSFFSAQTPMVRQSLLREANMRPELGCSGDTVFFAEALERTGLRIDFVPGVYMHYIKHGQNLTMAATDQIATEKAREIEVLRALFPQYPNEVSLRAADHEFILAFRCLRNMNIGPALSHLIRSIALSGWKWTAPRIIASEILFRIKRLRHQ